MTALRSRTTLLSDTTARLRTAPSPVVAAVGYLTAAWALAFAAVSAYQVLTDGGYDAGLARYAAGLDVMAVLVLVLKLVGAAVAVAAVASWGARLPRVTTMLLWGGFGLLGLYSAGNVVLTVGTVSGLLEPSTAWTAAGGVTPHAVLYVLFFLAGTAMFGTLAISYRRRHPVHRGWIAAGLLGAPPALAALLVVAPALLEAAGMLPG